MDAANAVGRHSASISSCSSVPGRFRVSNRPCSATRPSFSTITDSKARARAARCSTQTRPRPARSSRMAACTRLWLAASRLLVASLSTSRSGRFSSARASAVFCRWAIDRRDPATPTGWSSPTSMMVSRRCSRSTSPARMRPTRDWTWAWP